MYRTIFKLVNIIVLTYSFCPARCTAWQHCRACSNTGPASLQLPILIQCLFLFSRFPLSSFSPPCCYVTRWPDWKLLNRLTGYRGKSAGRNRSRSNDTKRWCDGCQPASQPIETSYVLQPPLIAPFFCHTPELPNRQFKSDHGVFSTS